MATASSASAAPPTLTSLYPAGAQRGTSVEVTAAGTLDAGTKVWVSGEGVSVEVAKGKWKVAVGKDAVPGVYRLRSHNAEGVSTARPFVVGTLPEVSEKEPNDDARKPQAIDGNAMVNGKLEKAGDVDCFAVPLKKGQTLVASLDAHHTFRSPMDAVLQVVSADGFVLAENHDFRGLDPQITYVAKHDGTFIVRVFAFPSQPDSSIRFFGSDACIYRLTLTTGPFADFAVPLGVSKAGTPSLEVSGWNLTPESRKLTFRHDERFATAFSASLANPVRVRSEPHPTFGLKLPEVLKPPFSVTQQIETPGGETLIPFEGKKGQPLALEVESRTFGLAVHPVVRVLDKEKKQLARAEPAKLNGDTAVSFTPPLDGTYTVAVSDLYGGGGTRFAFLLRVLTEPDYDLTVAADKFTVAPGKPLAIPVKVVRKLGFAKPVEVSVEGLPAGVKVEVMQPAKPDPNTVTLAITPDAAFSGSFTIVGKVAGEPALRRTATAPLADFDESVTQLWLTVTATAAAAATKEP